MEKTDLKIWIAIAFVLMAWGLWGVYKIASQYRQPLDLPPSQPAVEEWHRLPRQRKMKNDHKKFEKWAMPRLRQMQKVLLLEHFDPLELEYNSKRPEASESQFNYPYQSIVIRYSEDCLQLWKDKRYQKVLGTLFHEMTHQLTDALYAKACNTWRSKEELEDEREKLTDHIASMLLKLNLIK